VVNPARGEIWWADLPPPAGCAPGYRRPVLIVQSDAFNESRVGTVVVVAITSNLALARAPGNVLLEAVRSGLPKDSVANVSQVLTIGKESLTEKIGPISREDLCRVEEGLRLALDL